MTDTMTGYATPLSEDTVRIERSLPGPIERVWTYLTDSDKRATWLARGPMDSAEGGKVELTWFNSKLSGQNEPPPEEYKNSEGHSMTGRVLACDPPHLLSFTWSGETSESVVTFELSQQSERVKLVLTHSRLANRGAKLGVAGGWHAHLDILEDVLSDRPARPFWSNHKRLKAEYEARL